MCRHTAGLLALVARIAICAIFFTSAIANKIPNFNQTVDVMRAKGIPFPQVALVVAIIMLIVGSASVVVGYKSRWGAAMLLAFLTLATFYFHDFWNVGSDAARVQQIMFMKNVSIGGTKLLIIATGSGPWSIDACCDLKENCDYDDGLEGENS